MRLREARDRYRNAEAVMNALSTLQSQRVSLLDQLSPAARAEVTGLGSGAWLRLRSEVSHVRLMTRWYPTQRRHLASDITGVLRNALAASRLGVGLVGLLVTLAALLTLRRLARSWLARLRAWLALRLQPRSLMLRIDGLLKMLMAIVPEVIALLTIYVLFDVLLRASKEVPEVWVVGRLAYAYAWYALGLAFVHRVFLTAVSRYRSINFELNRKILDALRMIARLALGISVYLILAQALLGRGALFGISENLALLGALFVGWRLLNSWLVEITDAYLALFPASRLAEAVRQNSGGSRGLLIALAAFLFVAARGFWVWLRDLALSFEQTRKALAYLFRRRLERQSKKLPTATDPSLLPTDLQQAITESAAPEELCIYHYPQLGDVLLAAALLQEGKAGALAALTGERGSGKTTWLSAMQRSLPADLAAHVWSFDERIATQAGVCRQLSLLLGLADNTDPERLVQRILQQPPRVIVLDLAQNMMLRAVGGLAGYELFVRVAQATVKQVLWVAAFASWPFEYLQRIHPGRDVFDKTIVLRAWPEAQISALLDARLDAAGYTADYDHLLLDTAQISARPTFEHSSEDAAERNTDRYHRLIWDHSDGNPRIALHFFRLSLTWKQGKEVTVRLFSMPS